MSGHEEDFAGVNESVNAPATTIFSVAPTAVYETMTSTGSIPPPCYINSSQAFYKAYNATGGGGGGGVDSVSAGSGLVVSPTTGDVVVSMPNVGTAGVVSNPASITTDAQGRVSSVTSLGYTPVNPTALSAYAPLAGATFTGAVSGIAPTDDSNLTTKLYVDNAVAGGGSGVYLPLAGGTMTGDINMSGQELTFVSKISNATGDLDLSGDDVNIRQLSAGTEELPNVLNITSAGATAIASGGAITCSAVGAVNLTSGLSTTIYSTNGSVQIGGPINHITVESDGTTVSGVSDLTASGTVDAGSITTGALTATGIVNLSGATSVSVPTPTANNQATTKLYVDNAVSQAMDASQWANYPAVNTVQVPTEVSLQQVGATSLTMSMSDGGAVSASWTAPVPVPFVGGSITVSFPNQFCYLYDNTADPNNSSYATVGIAPATYNDTTSYVNALNTGIADAIQTAYNLTGYQQWNPTNFKIVATMSPTYYLTYTCYKTLSSTMAFWSQNDPISPPEPSGQTSAPLFGIQWNAPPVYFGELPQNVVLQYTKEGVAGAYETILTTSSNAPQLTYTSGTKTIGLTAENWNGDTVNLSSVSIATALADYIPLAGTEVGNPVVGPVVFQSGSSNIQCLDIQTGLISSLPDVDFVSVEDPLQTKLLGVRSSDGVSDPRIVMALSETSTPPDILNLQYDIANQALKINKAFTASGDISTTESFTTITGSFTTQNGDITTQTGDMECQNITVNGLTNTETLTTNGVSTIQGAMTITVGDLTLSGGVQAKNATAPVANADLTNKLYVDTAVATASGNVSNWATYVANATINANGNDIFNAKDISATGTIGTTDGNIGTVNGDIGSINGNVSGVQLQAGVNGITSLGPLNLDPTLSDPQSISGVRGITADDIIQANSFLANDTLATIGSASYALKTTDALFSSQAGTVASITYPDPTEQNAVAFFRGALSIEDPPNGGLPAQIIVNGVPWSSGADWSASPATSNVDMATYEISNAGAIASTSLSASDFITSSTTITGLDVVATNSLSVGAGALNVEQTLDFKPNATLYVAKNGNDTTGNGSSLQPYLTIQKAYDVAKLTSSSANIFCINIASGHYTENLNIVGKTYVWFVGSVSQSEGVGETTEITGDITVNANISGGDDLYNKVCGFVNLQITGSITVSSSNESSLVVKNCKFYSTDRAIYVNPSATDYRTYINNSYVAHQTAGVATNPLIEVSKGWLYATGGSWTALNNSSILSISGTGTAIQVGQITMESDNSSASLAPLVSITTTSTTTNTFGQCAMIAISATVKTTPAILINSATPPAINLLQNYFGITGTSAGGNVIQYAGTAPTLQIGGNASQFGTSAVIQSGITSVSTTGVGNNTFSSITSAVSSLGTASATSLATGSGAISGGAISGTTLTTTGAIKSSGTLQLSGNVISNASNNTSITGLNSITMGGTAPSITGVNSMTITNTNSTVPFTINNNTDNPTMVMGISPASTTIPCEFQINNSIITAVGNQNSDPRGCLFFFTNGKDVLRCPSTTMRLQLNYSPFNPTLSSSGTAGAWVAGTGSFVSGVPKLLGTQTITLSNLNLPIVAGGFGTPYHIGINGYINTCILNGAHDFQVSASYTRTRSGTTIGPFNLYGCSYPITSQAGGAFYSPLNGTTYNEAVVGERTTFTHGDILAIQVYGLYSGGGSPPNIITPASGLACVFSPFLV